MNSTDTAAPEIVVLAAGFSRRLGRNKALVKIGGVSVLGTLIGKLGTLSRGRISVVAARRSAALHEARRHRCTCILNPCPDAGMSRSVRMALKHRRLARGVMIVPVDLPDLQERDLRRLLRIWNGSPRKLIARRCGTRGGAPAIIPKRFFRLADTISGDVGLRDLIARLPAGETKLVAMPSADLDIDTPQNLRDARLRFGRGRRSAIAAGSGS